jgi:hypothetical protein
MTLNEGKAIHFLANKKPNKTSMGYQLALTKF